MADAFGRDVEQARVFVTGYAAIAPVTEDNVIARTDLAATSLTVPSGLTGYQYLGLRTTDGGPEEGREAGENIEFLEQGFQINGDGSLTLTMTLAQWNEQTYALIYGEAHTDGGYDMKLSIPNTQYLLLQESAYANGDIERRIGVVRVSEITEVKDERNVVKGITIVFARVPHDLFDGSAGWVVPVVEDSAP